MKTDRFHQGARTLRKLCIPLAVATLAACGGGGSGVGSSPGGAGSVLSGVAVDGYLQAATVFLDVNRNGSMDANEPFATTDATGHYALDVSQLGSAVNGLPLVVTGGIDTDTGYAFTGRLSATADKAVKGQVVTPLTSLVDAVLAQGLAPDANAAKTLVANALGLTAADLASDPVAALATQPTIYSTSVALQRVVQLLAALNAQPGESSQIAQARVMRAFAKAVRKQSKAVTVSQLVADLPSTEQLTKTVGAQQMANLVHDGVKTALTVGGHDRAKAVLKGLDLVRVRMENDHDDDLVKAANHLDSERGLSTIAPFTKLVKSDASESEITAIQTLLGKTTVVTQPANTNGRLLASNCFQCHGTGGLGGFESIRGNASEVKQYLGKTANSDIMTAHAQGYTSAQLDAIIAYLQQ